MTDTVNPAQVEQELAALENEIAGDSVGVESSGISPGPDQAEKEWKEMLGQLFGPLFGIFAPAWNVQTKEVEALAEAYAPVLVKYCPDVSGFGPEIGALFTTTAVFGPRLKMPRKAPALPETESQEGADNAES